MADIIDKTCGHWPRILKHIGVPEAALQNKHGPCPICGGKDRFRFDDREGRGTYFCNQCGPGDGMTLAMKFTNKRFAEVAKIIDGILADRTYVPQSTGQTKPPVVAKAMSEHEAFALEMKIVERFYRANQFEDSEVANRYFASRGITTYGTMGLRFHNNIHYRPDGDHPSILALVCGADARGVQIQSTHLKRDGSGKADIANPRTFMRGPLPAGSAVRLCPPAPVLGIAEGIETALSAAQLFGIPVWAALTANNLAQWVPPNVTRAVVIFADNDANRTGQIAAETLAARLAKMGMKDVRMRMPKEVGTDWNDVLVKEAHRIRAD